MAVSNDTCKIYDWELKPLCPDNISKYMTQKAALAVPHTFHDYTKGHKNDIVVRGYTDFYGGYAEHTRQTLFGLDNLGKYRVKLINIPSNKDIDPILLNRMNHYIGNNINKEKADYLCIAGPGHFQKKLLPTIYRRNISWTMIETLDVQEDIVEWLNNADLNLVPTIVDVERFVRGGVNNVKLCRIGYDDDSYNEGVEELDITNLRNRYVFGVLGSWNYRKGVHEIVEAFCKSFSSRDRVSLLLCCKYGTRPHGEEEENEHRWSIKYEIDEIINKLNIDQDIIPHIVVMDRPVHPNVMPNILKRFDCLVGFSKGESTWLPGLEYAAMNKGPIIQLNNACCGYMDYLNENPYMCKEVEYKECGIELYKGTSEYYEGQKMGYGSVDELGEMMYRVYVDRNTVYQKSEVNKLHSSISGSYTWKNSVLQLDKILNGED